jgi:very-short-patch-repair endonuclease
MTPAEALLWARLRNRRCGGFKFRRQVVIDRFIADFECQMAKLIVEVDGATHDFTEEYDAERTRWLGFRGYQVIRFSNAEVQTNLEGVVEAIRQTCEARTSGVEPEL